MGAGEAFQTLQSNQGQHSFTSENGRYDSGHLSEQNGGGGGGTKSSIQNSIISKGEIAVCRQDINNYC